LPREFRDLGGEDQVLRSLRSLVREKRLVRPGCGVYGRAVASRLSGAPILYSQNGFLARGSLAKPNGTTTKDVRYRFRSIRWCRYKGDFRADSAMAIRSWCLPDKPSLQDVLEVQKHFALPSPVLVEKGSVCRQGACSHECPSMRGIQLSSTSVAQMSVPLPTAEASTVSFGQRIAADTSI
jgi:hypothetical protein